MQPGWTTAPTLAPRREEPKHAGWAVTGMIAGRARLSRAALATLDACCNMAPNAAAALNYLPGAGGKPDKAQRCALRQAQDRRDASTMKQRRLPPQPGAIQIGLRHGQLKKPTMNLIGHLACAKLRDPAFQLGSMLPDLLGMYTRRPRATHLVKFWREKTERNEEKEGQAPELQPPPHTAAIIEGIQFHLHVL